MDEKLVEYFIKNLIFIALAVVACLAYRLIVSKSKIGKRCKNKTLTYPLSRRLAPLVSLGYGVVVCMLVALIAPRDVIYAYAAILAAVFGVAVSATRFVWRVIVGEDKFTCVSFLGVKRTYGYEDLELRKNANGTKWVFYSGETVVFSVPYYIVGADSLVEAYYSYRRGKEKNKRRQADL